MTYSLEDYIALVYERLGLDPDGHEVGTTRFIELPDKVLWAVCNLRLNKVRKKLVEMWQERWEEDAAYNCFMPFEEWREKVKRFKTYEYGDVQHPDHHKRRDAIVGRAFSKLHKVKRYEANFAGWVRYISDVSPEFFEKLLKEFPVRIPRDNLLNCYIVASSQSGKTELLKLFAHSIIRERNEALIFIEPAGDASRQIALWPECKDRLIYVDLSLDLSRAPTVNPFEIYGIRADDTSLAALEVKTVVAQQLMSAFQEVLGTGSGAELSKNMQTIVMHCLMVLLDYPGATLRDLRRFMDDNNNSDPVAFACSSAHYPDVRDFFTHSFHRKHYAVTKDAIQSKLESLFASGKFARLTCGPSTFMLEKAIEERKIIIFNLAEGSVGEQESSAFGRLIVSLLQGIAVRRDKQKNRVATRVIIDEFHNFTTRSMEKIITQAAKYRLYLTLANQQIAQIASKELRDAVLNVSVLIGGRNQPTFHGPVASMLNVDPDAIGGLERGDFIMHLSGVPPLQFRIHTHLLRNTHRMSEREWQEVEADQRGRYYRPISQPVPVPQILPPAKVVPYARQDVTVRRPRPVKAGRREITEEEEGII